MNTMLKLENKLNLKIIILSQDIDFLREELERKPDEEPSLDNNNSSINDGNNSQKKESYLTQILNLSPKSMPHSLQLLGGFLSGAGIVLIGYASMSKRSSYRKETACCDVGLLSTGVFSFLKEKNYGQQQPSGMNINAASHDDQGNIEFGKNF